MPTKTPSIKKVDYSSMSLEAIQKIRESAFKNKQPFVIADPKLPNQKCYLEYKDGKITLARVQTGTKGFITEKELNPYEKWDLKKRLRLNEL